MDLTHNRTCFCLPFRRFFLFLCIILSFSGTSLLAQGFKGSALVGVNIAQIDGDFLHGFHKVGWSAGGRIGYALDKNKFLNLEMLYSERGSAVKLFEKNPANKYDLKYLEIPVIFSIHDWYNENKKYYIVRAEAGFSYGALFQLDVPIVDENDFKKNDISYILGIGFQFTKNIGLSFRYTRSLFDMLDTTLSDGRNIKFRGYFITSRLEYHF